MLPTLATTTRQYIADSHIMRRARSDRRAPAEANTIACCNVNHNVNRNCSM